MIAQVLVELMNKNVDKTFDYLVPSTMQDKITVGIRVKVPFGNRTLEGFVLSLSNDSNYQKLKSIKRTYFSYFNQLLSSDVTESFKSKRRSRCTDSLRKNDFFESICSKRYRLF